MSSGLNRLSTNAQQLKSEMCWFWDGEPDPPPPRLLSRVLTMELGRKCAAAPIVSELLDGNEGEWKRRKNKKVDQRSEEKGYFNYIVQELNIEDAAEYAGMPRMCHQSVHSQHKFL